MATRFRFFRLKDVDWNEYGFHITPVLTYTKVIHYNSDVCKALSIEWGHWAISFQLHILNKQD
jgi:hypothetical protein